MNVLQVLRDSPDIFYLAKPKADVKQHVKLSEFWIQSRTAKVTPPTVEIKKGEFLHLMRAGLLRRDDSLTGNFVEGYVLVRGPSGEVS